MKVPPNCSNVKGGAKAQRNSILGGGPPSASSPTATFSTLSSLPPELAPTGTPISELKHRASLRESSSSSGALAGAGAGAATSAAAAARSPQANKRGGAQAGSHGSLNQLQAHVIYDYDASSPGELTVRVGDVVTILEGDDGMLPLPFSFLSLVRVRLACIVY